MCVNHNIYSWVRAGIFMVLVASIPAASLADETAPSRLDPIEAPGDPATVSALAPRIERVDARTPLTRAAARQRVEAMSPVDWLASYGDVVVGRTGQPEDAAP